MAKISSYPIISVPTLNDLLIGTDVENLNETKNFSISGITNLILVDSYVPYVNATKDVDLGSYTITGGGYIVNGGTASDFLKADGTLDSTIYQPAGNYITQLSGEATAAGPGNASVTLSNSAVINKVLTGLTITGDAVVATDSILTAFGKVQNQINTLVGGVQYKGTWNAATNTPTLVSSVGVQGNYYVVSVAGNTNLNGITDWKLGDWAIFNGSAWEKVDNTDAVISVNGQIGEVVLTTTDIAEGTNLYYTESRVRNAISLTTTGNSGASTYSNVTGVFNIPNYTLAGLGGVPLTRQLTINGTAFDLSANRSWNVGTVTSVATSGPLTGGTITGSGTIGITQSSASSDGYLSSTDWTTFNNKQNAITNPVTGTGTPNTLPMWGSTTSLVNSPLSYAADAFNFGFNSSSGGTVNFTNTGLTTYTYSIQMNNFGSPRSTVHSYTDGIVVNSIGGTQVSRMFANGNLILGTGFVDNGYKLELSGSLFVNSIANATTDTDRFLVSDGGALKYRTGSEVLSDIGAVPITRTLTINGTAFDLSADRSWSVGTVTSVDMSVPSGFAIAGNPVTGAGTLSLSFASGFSLPSNATQATWTTAYNNSIVSAAVTGTTTKTLTLNQQDGGTVTASWTDIAPVTSVFGRIGDILAQSGDYTTTLVTEGTNLYFTNSRARLAISLTTTGSSGAATYNNTTGVLNIPDYGSALTGYVPYTGANQTVNLNTQQLIAGHATFTTNGSTDTLTINHTSGSGRGIIVTKSGSGEGLTVVKSSGSGNVASITGGVTLISELNLTTSLADAYIASAANWNTAYNNRITSLTTTGTSGAATLVSHVLNIPQYQAQGNYITSLTGEATASGPGAAAVTLTNSAVTGKVLTGLTVAGSSIASTDSILTAFGKLQGQVNDLIGGLQYQGTWNASTNTPTITSSVGSEGYFYIVSVAGNTIINGIGDWQVGDWIVFHGTTWQKVDNTESVVSVNGFVGAVTLTTSNITEGTNLYFTNARARTAISLTTTGNSGAATYTSGTGVFNVPQYTLTGLGGVPNTRSITINGTAFDLSADRTYNVGTVTSIATSGPITGGTITGTGTIGITQSSSSSNGFLSSTDWNTFNGKQNTISLTTTGTSGAATLVGTTINIPIYQSVLTNPVTGTGASGQVAFWNGATTQTGDNGLFWDNTNKRLGIGTNVPTSILEVSQSLSPIFRISSSALTIPNLTDIGTIEFYSNDASISARGVKSFVKSIAELMGANQGSASLVFGTSANNEVNSTERWRITSTGIFQSNGAQTIQTSSGALTLQPSNNVLIGTTTDAGFRLDVNGTARVQGAFTATADSTINGVPIGRGANSLIHNIRIGNATLLSVTTGDSNVAISPNALQNNTTGINNIAIGRVSLLNNATGIDNVAIGRSTLSTNTVGFGNTAIGHNSLNANTGNNNSALGSNSLVNLSSGNNNIAIGNSSGRFIENGSTVNSISNNSVFLGSDTRANADNQTNQIVIGHNAIGLGSNTPVIGNSSTTFGRWFGSLLIGTSTNIASSALTVESTTQGFLPPRMTAAQRTAIVSPAEGLIVFQTDSVIGLYIYANATWRALTMTTI